MLIYNSLTNKKEEFKPIHDNKVGFYSCGPTVYNLVHIGNLRAYVFTDIAVKTLRALGYKVKWVMNITDVEDKTIRDSKIKYPDLDPMAALAKFTMEYAGYFWADSSLLNIDAPDETPHATKFMPQIQDMVLDILKRGYAYEKEGSIYFSIQKYIKNFHYGELVNIDFDKMKQSERTESDDYEKENAQDFVLWKGKKEGEPFWDFEIEAAILGQTVNNGKKINLPGRPGWHIECSAMGKSILGFPFDIHNGGIDLKFPHHENEIAQNNASCDIKCGESCYGAASQPRPVNFWLHNEHLLIDSEKMSKSKHNFFTLRDIMDKKIKPLALRYFYLNTHYRSPINFTWDAALAAQNALANLYDKFLDLPSWSIPLLTTTNKEYWQKFLDAISDDFNTPQALAIMWELIKDDKIEPREKRKTLLEFDEILGLGLNKAVREKIEIPKSVKRLLKRREEARAAKDFNAADVLRQEIEGLGFTVEDMVEGQRVKKL